MPEQWASNNKALQLNLDPAKTVSTNHLPEEVRTFELPDDIISFIKMSNTSISKPMMVEHKVHIEVDSNEIFGLKGLTTDMIILLKQAGI